MSDRKNFIAIVVMAICLLVPVVGASLAGCDPTAVFAPHPPHRHINDPANGG